MIGNETGNSAVIIDYLTANQHNGDRLRRVFPLSPFDYSIELTIDADTHERSYSCVIDRHGEYEATLFTYIVRTIGTLSLVSRVMSHLPADVHIDVEDATQKTIEIKKNDTSKKPVDVAKTLTKLQKILSHDALTRDQIEELRKKNTHTHGNTESSKSFEHSTGFV